MFELPKPRIKDYYGEGYTADQMHAAYQQGLATKNAAIDALQRMTEDRDEWRKQHDLLVGVREADLKVMQARIDALQATLKVAVSIFKEPEEPYDPPYDVLMLYAHPPAQSAADDACEILATALHFIPSNEPDLSRDLEALCHSIRYHNPPAQPEQPVPPSDDNIADSWVSASESDGIAYDGPSFERGYRLGRGEYDEYTAALVADAISSAQPEQAERDALQARVRDLCDLIRRVHKAKGRYHTQLAICDLFDSVGLSNERPSRSPARQLHAVVPVVDRKRSDDTEGGAHD